MEETTSEPNSGVEVGQDDAGAAIRPPSFRLQSPVEKMGIKLDTGPAPPLDDRPAGPPERICAICGTRWRYEKDRASPCGHVDANGIQTVDVEQSATLLCPKVKVEYVSRGTKKWSTNAEAVER
jgi:hypothetical protein